MLRFVTILLVLGAAQCSILPFLKTPRHDGVKRVCTLTTSNFTTVVNAADIAVVIFSPADGTQKSPCPSEMDVFAEVTAQVLRKKNSIVCEASPDVVNVPEINAVTQVSPGEVYIYKKGKGTPYYGKRSTRALLNYLFKVNGTQVNVITGKLDKIAFDAVQQVKIVGFFMQGTADYQAFEDAAALLSPSVLFYTVFDRTVAKHLKLTTVGEIHLVKPFSKTPVVCPKNPATAADIEAFVKSDKGAVLAKINEQNLYDPNLVDSNRILVLAIAEEASSLGGYFHYLLTKLVRNSTNITGFETLNLVWVEPQIFPSIYLMMDELETTFGIPNQFPAFGALNVTTMQSSWLNTSLLNCTSDKTSDAKNMEILLDFLNGAINKTLIPVKLGVQSLVQVPSSQTVVEGSQVVLECVVENIVGDCLWLKDGHNIGFNLDRIPHYNWRGDRLTGDCSLVINSALLGRDNGEWVCEVTGDPNSPTLSSPPAKLLIATAVAASPTIVKSEL